MAGGDGSRVAGRERPIAFLLFGPPGVGKTALARALEAGHRAVRFSPDEWMGGLFGPDPPADGVAARADAINRLLRPLWTRRLALGTAVVLDAGLWRRSERDEARSLAREAGAVPLLCAPSCSDAEAWRRVERRNHDPGCSLHLSRITFDLLRTRVEALGPDEPHVGGPSDDVAWMEQGVRASRR